MNTTGINLILPSYRTRMYEYILRIGIAGTFLGHGTLALGIKEKWIPLIMLLGFDEETARNIMPFIGIADIAVAIFILVRPVRAVILWAVLWTFMTALARPLAGEHIAEFVERTANWAAPLALLIFQGFPKKWKDLWSIR